MVSVILPTYNRISSLKKSLKCLLNQSINIYEIIVCDDNSTDGTKEYIKLLSENHSNLIYLKNSKKNRGLAGNFDIGYKHAKYDLIFIAHDDNYYSDSLLKKMYNKINNENSAMVFDNTGFIKDENVFESSCEERMITYNHNKIISDPNYLWGYYCKTLTSAPWGTCMFSKKLTERVGGINYNYENLFDVELWIKLSCYYKVSYLSETLIRTGFRDIEHWNYFRLYKTDKILIEIYKDCSNLFNADSNAWKKLYIKLSFYGFLQYLKYFNFKKAFRYYLLCINKLIIS